MANKSYVNSFKSQFTGIITAGKKGGKEFSQTSEKSYDSVETFLASDEFSKPIYDGTGFDPATINFKSEDYGELGQSGFTHLPAIIYNSFVLDGDQPSNDILWHIGTKNFIQLEVNNNKLCVNLSGNPCHIVEDLTPYYNGDNSFHQVLISIHPNKNIRIYSRNYYIIEVSPWKLNDSEKFPATHLTSTGAWADAGLGYVTSERPFYGYDFRMFRNASIVDSFEIEPTEKFTFFGDVKEVVGKEEEEVDNRDISESRWMIRFDRFNLSRIRKANYILDSYSNKFSIGSISQIDRRGQIWQATCRLVE